MAQRNPIEQQDLQEERPESADGTPLAVQPHGGALKVGNPKGSPPGPGIAPSVVRDRARRSFYDRINALEAMADGKGSERDRIRAIDTLGKYGLMTGRLDIQEVQVCLQRTLAEIERQLPPDQAARLLKALEPIWNPTQ